MKQPAKKKVELHVDGESTDQDIMAGVREHYQEIGRICDRFLLTVFSTIIAVATILMFIMFFTQS